MVDDFKLVKKQKQNIAFLLIALLLSQIVIMLFAMGKGTKGCDIASLICFFSTFLVIYAYQPEIFLKYLWHIIVSIWGVIAVYMLENGSVLLRGKTSTHYGSLPTYVLGWLVFWETIVWMEICKKKRYASKQTSPNYNEILPNPSDIRTLKYISCAAIGLICLCFISVANKPYFIYGIDRFQYGQTIMPKIVSDCMLILYAITPVPIMLRKESKWIPITYCTLFILLNAWCGEKFTGLIVIFYYIILATNPLFISKMLSKYIKKIIITIGGVILALLILVVIQQFVLGLKISDISNYFENRIAAQGEVWWLMFAQDATRGMHWDEISDEIDVLINQPKGEMPEYYFGIYKMMKLFLYSDWVKYALNYGARATESTRATFFYYGKIPGLIIGQVLLAILLFFLVNKILESCNNRRWVQACLYMYIMRSAITASIMSDFQLLTTKKMILVYLVLLVVGSRKVVLGRKA